MSAPEFRLNNEVVESPPRPAATVLLLRDGANGLEVLMQRRHDESDVLGGAYVFPGGKVDGDDAAPEMLARIDVDAERLHALLGDPELAPGRAAANYVAAARETFEEAGVLLARRADGTAVDALVADRATALSREGRAFVEVLEALDLTLAVSRLIAWSRWVTPRTPSLQRKRFDSRFFLGRVPADQVARHDNRETTDSVWVAPADALRMSDRREIMLAPPQIMSLIELMRHGSADEAFERGAYVWPRRIDPHTFEHDGTRALAYPGDPLHGGPDQVMPGPTRLIFRRGRFQPFDGYESLGL